jgi:adenine C2-methylase RlmN of 23S rRNA A2503 and tRNA A37
VGSKREQRWKTQMNIENKRAHKKINRVQKEYTLINKGKDKSLEENRKLVQAEDDHPEQR